MILHTKFGPGDRVRYIAPKHTYYDCQPGDLFTITAVHVRAWAGNAEIAYSAKIDEQFVPRLVDENCTIRVFHIPEHKLEAMA